MIFHPNTQTRFAASLRRGVAWVPMVGVLAVALFGIGVPASAQWNPQQGQYGKTTETDFRVMTWNVRNAINSQANKNDSINAWNAVVRIVAAMKPDVLILQECGGLPNNAGVDNITNLLTTFDLFINGGPDPFNGNNPVGSYLKLFDADLDYFVFVSSSSDGFNRNVILSRYPFEDLNNASNTVNLSDIAIFGSDAYAPGGNGGVRGYQFAEIGLPQDIYAGGVVIGNGHLKAFGGCSDELQRETAARNIAYFIDYFYNGAGTGIADPNNKIPFGNNNTTILDEFTPVIWGGDLNQSLTSSGCWSKNPVRWLAEAQLQGATDGTDRDRTDSTIDTAAEPITGNVTTQGSTNGGASNKIDYLLWQDSIANATRQFVFNSNLSSGQGALLPPPVDTFPFFSAIASSTASDHRPVIVDFQLPLAEVTLPCPGDLTEDGVVDTADLGILLGDFGCLGPDCDADLNDDGQVDTNDLGLLLGVFGSTCD